MDAAQYVFYSLLGFNANKHSIRSLLGFFMAW